MTDRRDPPGPGREDARERPGLHEGGPRPVRRDPARPPPTPRRGAFAPRLRDEPITLPSTFASATVTTPATESAASRPDGPRRDRDHRGHPHPDRPARTGHRPGEGGRDRPHRGVPAAPPPAGRPARDREIDDGAGARAPPRAPADRDPGRPQPGESRAPEHRGRRRGKRSTGSARRARSGRGGADRSRPTPRPRSRSGSATAARGAASTPRRPNGTARAAGT